MLSQELKYGITRPETRLILLLLRLNDMLYACSTHRMYAFGAIAKYPVVFTESGLPSGKWWSVTFNGKTQNTTSNLMTFYAQDGENMFLITLPTGYAATPISSSLVVMNRCNAEHHNCSEKLTDFSNC